MSHDRNALITAYRAMYGGSDIEADRIVRGVESSYAEKQNAELLKALDDADGRQIQAEAEAKSLRKRYLLAWKLAYQWAQGRGWAADRASERLASVMEANQELLGSSLSAQIDNQRLQAWMERIPQEHMRFGVIDSDGKTEMLECADWCYACKLDRLQADVDEWKRHEAEARGACIQLAQIHGHPGSVLARLQAGHYESAIALIKDQVEMQTGSA